MGKIILEFDSFEEKTEAQNALDGGSWKALVNEFDQELRAVTKYGGSLLDPKNEASEIEIDVCNKRTPINFTIMFFIVLNSITIPYMTTVINKVFDVGITS